MANIIFLGPWINYSNDITCVHELHTLEDKVLIAAITNHYYDSFKFNTKCGIIYFKDIKYIYYYDNNIEDIKSKILNKLKDYNYHYPTEEQFLLL